MKQKHWESISYDSKCKFNSRTCNSKQKWNNDKSQCECKNIVHAKKIPVGILAPVFVKILGI